MFELFEKFQFNFAFLAKQSILADNYFISNSNTRFCHLSKSRTASRGPEGTSPNQQCGTHNLFCDHCADPGGWCEVCRLEQITKRPEAAQKKGSTCVLPIPGQQHCKQAVTAFPSHWFTHPVHLPLASQRILYLVGFATIPVAQGHISTEAVHWNKDFSACFLHSSLNVRRLSSFFTCSSTILNAMFNSSNNAI